MSGLDCLGANIEIGANTEIGFDITQGLGPILQAAGGLATGIADTVKQAQDEKKLAADQAAKVKAATAADLGAAMSLAKAAVSAKVAEGASATPAQKSAAIMDRKAADVAVAAQQAAAAKLTDDGSEVRAAAAQTAQNTAIAAAQAAPNDVYKAALVDAWTSIINKANNAAMVSNAPGASGEATSGGSGGESFLTKKIVGPIPTWGVGLGAVAAGLLAKKFLGK